MNNDVRTEIMRLENEKVFDQRAWAAVLAKLTNSPCSRQDAVRRMITARQNAVVFVEQPHWVGGIDLAGGPDVTVVRCVAAETVEGGN